MEHPWWTWPSRRLQAGWLYLGVVLRQGSTRYAATLAVCDQALATGALTVSELAGVRLVRGIALLRLGRAQEARDECEALLALPGGSRVQRLWARQNCAAACLQLNEATAAWAELDELILEHGGSEPLILACALLNRAHLAADHGRTDVALADIDRLLREQPKLPALRLAQAYTVRARAWSLSGETARAIEDLTRVIAQPRRMPATSVAHALLLRGGLWLQEEQPERTLADATRVIEHLPAATRDQVASARVNLALALERLGRTDEALTEYQRVLDQPDPLEPSIRVFARGDLGWLRYRTGDYAGVLADTETALESPLAPPVFHFNRGLALLALGRDDEALAAYQAALHRPVTVGWDPRTPAARALEEVVAATGQWLSHERARPVRDLLEGR